MARHQHQHKHRSVVHPVVAEVGVPRDLSSTTDWIRSAASTAVRPCDASVEISSLLNVADPQVAVLTLTMPAAEILQATIDEISCDDSIQEFAEVVLLESAKPMLADQGATRQNYILHLALP